MRSLRRFVIVTVDASLFESGGIGPCGSGAAFEAAEAEEYDLRLFLERGQVGDFVCADASAAEQADMGELVQVGERDLMGLHAAHGKPGHGAIGWFGECAEIRVNKGNQLVYQAMLKVADVEEAATTGAT